MTERAEEYLLSQGVHEEMHTVPRADVQDIVESLLPSLVRLDDILAIVATARITLASAEAEEKYGDRQGGGILLAHVDTYETAKRLCDLLAGEGHADANC